MCKAYLEQDYLDSMYVLLRMPFKVYPVPCFKNFFQSVVSDIKSQGWTVHLFPFELGVSQILVKG